MRNARQIKKELAAARARIQELEEELREATTVAYLAVFNQDEGSHSIVPISSELVTKHQRFTYTWYQNSEIVVVDWPDFSQEVEMDETEEWFEDTQVLFHLSETRRSAARWIDRKLHRR